MKKLFWKIVKWFSIITYPVLLSVLIAVGFLLWQKERQISESLTTYKQMYSEQSIPGEPKNDISSAIKDVKDNIVSNLYKEISNLNSEIDSLNGMIESAEKEGYGEIRGSILPFVSNEFGLDQYQRVCAQEVDNLNKQFCVSVSAIKKDYALAVPAGSYYVYAQIQNASDDTFKAYYTEFVQCSRSEADNCGAALSDKNLIVNVEPSQVVTQIDPIDWKDSLKSKEN